MFPLFKIKRHPVAQRWVLFLFGKPFWLTPKLRKKPVK